MQEESKASEVFDVIIKSISEKWAHIGATLVCLYEIKEDTSEYKNIMSICQEGARIEVENLLKANIKMEKIFTILLEKRMNESGETGMH